MHFGKWVDALKWLEKHAHKLDPTNDKSLYSAFYINIAALYQQSGHYDKAIDVLKIIMKIIPKTNCHYSKALFYLCMGDISLSLGNTDFQEFDIDPNYKHFVKVTDTDQMTAIKTFNVMVNNVYYPPTITRLRIY